MFNCFSYSKPTSSLVEFTRQTNRTICLDQGFNITIKEDTLSIFFQTQKYKAKITKDVAILIDHTFQIIEGSNKMSVKLTKYPLSIECLLIPNLREFLTETRNKKQTDQPTLFHPIAIRVQHKFRSPINYVEVAPEIDRKECILHYNQDGKWSMVLYDHFNNFASDNTINNISELYVTHNGVEVGILQYGYWPH